MYTIPLNVYLLQKHAVNTEKKEIKLPPKVNVYQVMQQIQISY